VRAGRTGVTPEIRLAHAALVTCLALLLPAGMIGLLLGGRPAALGAAGGVVVVGVLLLASLPLYRWGATRPPGTVVRLAPVGILVRLGLGAVLVAVAADVPGLSLTAFAAGLAVALLSAQVAEMVIATRDPRLYWVDPTANRRTAA
jgi:hypothetical protein